MDPQIKLSDDLDQAFREILNPDNPKKDASIISDIGLPEWEFNNLLKKIQQDSYAHIADQYMKYYRNAMGSILKQHKDSSSNAVIHKIGNWSFGTAHISDVHPHMYLIAPLNSKGEYATDKIFEVLKDLHQSLIFIHKILWNHFKGNTFEVPDRQKMVLWLFGEVFNPESGLPVMGKTKLTKFDESKLGVIQVLMINLLRYPEQALEYTSISIAGIWFKHTHNKEWDIKFKKDVYYWARVYILITREISDQQNFPDFQIGDFKLEINRKVGELMTQNALLKHLIIPESSESIIKSIYITVFNFFDVMDKGWEMHEITSQPELAIIRFGLYPDMFGIHPLTSPNNRIKPFPTFPNIKENFIRFFKSLQFYSDLILTNLNGQLGNKFEKLSQYKFLVWFSKKLLYSSVGNLFPVIGMIPKSALDASNISKMPILDEVQVFIAKILQNNILVNDDIQLSKYSVNLLGYWLKNENPILWKEVFKNQQILLIKSINKLVY
ncbi:hypothetical protein PGTUg99_028298 [Puccinia graminis f. sp. tritici]|uniref:Uncharacterized protein n=1 Tax=Puccinia graminis f. sp. tritici TaxID=56615 RepID=A0A5B0S7H6_PUCGR|nr:hypothetical protein PGTUg99_028298 [Puccinia graminis f. sp. tritici]